MLQEAKIALKCVNVSTYLKMICLRAYDQRFDGNDANRPLELLL